MDMTGQRTLQVTQQQAWEALNDPEILKACIPGCQKFEPAGDQKFAVAAGIKMGPVSALFNGHVQLTDIVAPESYKLNFDAQGGVAGFGKGESAVEIKPLEKGCELQTPLDRVQLLYSMFLALQGNVCRVPPQSV